MRGSEIARLPLKISKLVAAERGFPREMSAAILTANESRHLWNAFVFPARYTIYLSPPLDPRTLRNIGATLQLTVLARLCSIDR